MAVTSIYFAWGRSIILSMMLVLTLALYFPYNSNSSSFIPIEAAISVMGSISVFWAISRSDNILSSYIVFYYIELNYFNNK